MDVALTGLSSASNFLCRSAWSGNNEAAVGPLYFLGTWAFSVLPTQVWVSRPLWFEQYVWLQNSQWKGKKSNLLHLKQCLPRFNMPRSSDVVFTSFMKRLLPFTVVDISANLYDISVDGVLDVSGCNKV